MTKTREDWLGIINGLNKAGSLEALIVTISLIRNPDQEDLSFFQEITSDPEKYKDILLPTIALMTTFFPNSVNIEFEKGAAEGIFDKLRKDGKLFEK